MFLLYGINDILSLYHDHLNF